MQNKEWSYCLFLNTNQHPPLHNNSHSFFLLSLIRLSAVEVTAHTAWFPLRSDFFPLLFPSVTLPPSAPTPLYWFLLFLLCHKSSSHLISPCNAFLSISSFLRFTHRTSLQQPVVLQCHPLQLLLQSVDLVFSVDPFHLPGVLRAVQALHHWKNTNRETHFFKKTNSTKKKRIFN